MATECCVAMAQAPAQAFLRPGMWLPGVKRLHMAQESWKIQANPDECLEKLLDGVGSIADEEHMVIHKVDQDRHFVQIFSFTPNCNWLDVVEIRFWPGPGEETGITRGNAVSFSSGFLPVCCPFAFITNLLFFWVPFSGNGVNTRRLNTIRDAMQMEVTITSEKKCNCCPS